MERLLAIISAALLIGLLLALIYFFTTSSHNARIKAAFYQFAAGSEDHQKEYGKRPTSIAELLGKNHRGIVFMKLPAGFLPTDYRDIPPPPNSDAFIIEWLGPDGAFGTGDELQMIHDDSGVTISPP